MAISERLKDLRKKHGLTQSALAEKVGLSIGTIQGYEQGRYEPKIETVLKLACALDLENLSELIEVSPSTEIMWKHREDDLGKKYFENYFTKQSPKTGEDARLDAIIDCYDKLNFAGRNKAVEQIELLTKIPEYKK